jgi:hypothetical protein
VGSCLGHRVNGGLGCMSSLHSAIVLFISNAMGLVFCGKEVMSCRNEGPRGCGSSESKMDGRNMIGGSGVWPERDFLSVLSQNWEERK